MPELILRQETRQTRHFIEQLGTEMGLDMILIPGSTFLMGSPENEPERSEDEGPQHEVTIPTFFLGRYPVTQSQWQFVAGLPQINQKLDPDPSNFKGANRPVEQVSWLDAMEFCDRLSTYTHRTYRLPSEAEWEYACRAGTTTPFHFGETMTTDLANYCGIDQTIENKLYKGAYGRGPKGEYRQKTTPVDHFTIANAFGLSDMHGNVWEWCQDHWHSNYQGAPIDGSAWLSEDKDSNYVLRGGSWFDYPGHCRSAYRFDHSPVSRSLDVGFRVVCRAPRTL